MNRVINKNSIKRQAQLNMAMSVVYQITAAICSLILPRYILLHFGSDVNGVLQSIDQMLSYTVIMECGVGGLITASFYKPIAQNDTEAISDIFNNSRRFFGRISCVYVALVLIISVFSKFIIKTEFSFGYLCSMALILGVSHYFNYYFALSHMQLLKADQKLRIIYASQSVTLALNTVVCIAAINFGAGIHIVKLVSAFVYLINPAVFCLYVKKHYKIGKIVYDTQRKFPRKTDGMIHHLAYFIHMNTDIVLISIFSGTKEVSVYSIYNAVIRMAESFFATVSESIATALGSVIAKGEKDKLSSSFEVYQTVNITAATFFCIAEGVLMLPFVKIYTGGVTDVNYIRPLFAYAVIFAQWFYCIRIPYYNTINAAGHYRQTKLGAYIETILNIVISVATVKPFGLFGVACGTAIAMGARSVYMAWYLSKNILYREMKLYLKDVILNALFGIFAVWWLSSAINIPSENLLVWAGYAVVVCALAFVSIVVFNIVINNKMAAVVMNFMKKQ